MATFACETVMEDAMSEEQIRMRARTRAFTAAWQEAFDALEPVRVKIASDTEELICEMHADLTASVEVIRRAAQEQGASQAAALAIEHERIFTDQWDQMLRLWMLRTLSAHERLISESVHAAITQAMTRQQDAKDNQPPTLVDLSDLSDLSGVEDVCDSRPRP